MTDPHTVYTPSPRARATSGLHTPLLNADALADRATYLERDRPSRSVPPAVDDDIDDVDNDAPEDDDIPSHQYIQDHQDMVSQRGSKESSSYNWVRNNRFFNYLRALPSVFFYAAPIPPVALAMGFPCLASAFNIAYFSFCAVTWAVSAPIARCVVVYNAVWAVCVYIGHVARIRGWQDYGVLELSHPGLFLICALGCMDMMGVALSSAAHPTVATVCVCLFIYIPRYIREF